MGIAKLPLAKELADLSFDGTPINAGLIEQLASGDFLQTKRNVVLIGGTGTGKSHIAIGIARSVIRAGRKARFHACACSPDAHSGEGDHVFRSMATT